MVWCWKHIHKRLSPAYLGWLTYNIPKGQPTVTNDKARIITCTGLQFSLSPSSSHFSQPKPAIRLKIQRVQSGNINFLDIFINNLSGYLCRDSTVHKNIHLKKIVQTILKSSSMSASFSISRACLIWFFFFPLGVTSVSLATLDERNKRAEFRAPIRYPKAMQPAPSKNALSHVMSIIPTAKETLCTVPKSSSMTPKTAMINQFRIIKKSRKWYLYPASNWIYLFPFHM